MSSFIKVMDIGLAAGLYSKFGTILGLDTITDDVLYYPKQTALRERAERKGSTQLEFINYWRTSTVIDWQRAKSPAARKGFWMPYSTEDGTTVNVKAMPVKMDYDVFFWTKDKDKLNQIVEAYLFWQQTDPNLDLLYQDLFPLELDLHFGAIRDESTVDQKFDKGMYFVHSMPIEVEGWVFTSTDPINNIIESIHLTCFDKDDLEVYSEVIEQSDDYDEEKSTTLKLFERTITE